MTVTEGEVPRIPVSYTREIIHDLLMEGYEIIHEWSRDGVALGCELGGMMKLLNHLASNHHFKGPEMYTVVSREYKEKWVLQGVCPDCKVKLQYTPMFGVPYCDQCDMEWGS